MFLTTRCWFPKRVFIKIQTRAYCVSFYPCSYKKAIQQTGIEYGLFSQIVNNWWTIGCRHKHGFKKEEKKRNNQYPNLRASRHDEKVFHSWRKWF